MKGSIIMSLRKPLASRLFKTVGCACAFLSFSSATYAATSSNATSVPRNRASAQNSNTGVSGSSVATTPAVELKEFKLPFNIYYSGFFYGPHVGSMTETSRHDDTIHNSAPASDGTSMPESMAGLEMRHQPGIGKTLSQNYSISGVLDFATRFTDPNPRAGVPSNTGFFWKDSFVRLNRSAVNIYKKRSFNFSIGGDMRVYVPSSKVARDANTVGALRFSLSPGIVFNNMFSLATVSYVKAWLQTKDRALGGGALPVVEFYSGPQFNFSPINRLNFYVLYEATLTRNSDGHWNNEPRMLNATTDVEPGVNIKITNNLTLSPFLNWYPALPLSTTNANLEITASL